GIRVDGADKVGIVNIGMSSDFFGLFAEDDAAEEYRDALIVGGDSAINVSADKVGIFNGPGGMIVGDGGGWETFEPVIQTYTDAGEITDEENWEDGGGTFLWNSGIMTSDTNPHVRREWGGFEVNE